MIKYALSNVNEKISAKAYGRGLRISTKNSIIVCRAINRKNIVKAKKFLKGLLERKTSIEGKYYDKTTSTILSILESAEKNAEFKGLNIKKLIVYASAHKGFSFHRPRRFKRRGERRKVTNIQIVLVEK
ncbi:MAG TPA: hypothetical protein ENG42_01250 [Candidatus Aenigmarchaeota archaeon]|nr:hypothetical protein [Candidatus Aenigmarchaeota archaeon]